MKLLLSAFLFLPSAILFAATNTWTGDLDMGPEAVLVGDANDLFRVGGSFNNQTTNPVYHILTSTFEFTGSGAHNLEQFSRDRGPCAGSISNNFAFGTLKTAGTITLVDNFPNSAGNDAVYVQTISGTGTLKVGTGLRLYFGTTNGWAGTVNLTGGIFRQYLPDNVDSDGDGLVNGDECACGTDPSDAGSALQITAIDRQGTGVRVTWMTGLGRANELLAGPKVTNIVQSVFTVTNTTTTVTNFLHLSALTNAPGYFYRVRLVP
jgi:hypothetical protein